jgi:uncharacterized protein (TIGR03000 family)
MYSFALIVAMNASVALPGDCHGGTACIGTSACYGGHLFGGHGCHGGLFGGHKLFGGHCLGSQCHGQACLGTSCHGGHLFGGHKLFGGHCLGSQCHGQACLGTSCHGGHLFGGHKLFGGHCLGTSCYGGQVMPAEKVPVKPMGMAAPANLIVNLPADATLSIDEAATTSTGSIRNFITPELEAGKTYTYTLKAEITRDGKIETITRQVEVRAGQLTNVTMEAPAAATVAR